MVNVYEYLDYRKLLKDLYEDRKEAQPFFSYRYIASKVGFTSAGFFTNILNGKRNISPEFVLKFAQLFKLNKKETVYFELLVNFNQAKNHEQKKYYFEKILTTKQSKIAITEAQQYELYSTWYFTAVRELCDVMVVSDENLDEVAKSVMPTIKPAEVARALEILSQLKFIKKDVHGQYKQIEQYISTGYDARAVAISNFLMATADLAKSAVDRLPRNMRSMSTLTVGISPETYTIIEERLKDFRREILEIVRADKKPDQVYHFNFHIFPMSKKIERQGSV